MKRSFGFTLVEVLVAMAIAAIALMAAVRATGALVSSSVDLRARTLAQWSAENRLSQLRIAREWPAIGRREFECGQAGIELVCVEQVFQTPNAQFRRVEIKVHLPGAETYLSRLVGFSTRQQ